MAGATTYAKLKPALPFWLSMIYIPITLLAGLYGGWWLALLPVWAFVANSVLDAVFGHEPGNPDPATPEPELFWHRLVTLVWFPIQFTMIFGGIWFVGDAAHLALWEKVLFFLGVGLVSGAVGIVFAHELMHQKNRLERWLGDLLMTSVLYGHFRSEHLVVHHSWVGTPRDAVTARYGEGFHRFFFRVLRDCFTSAWAAERARLARAGRPVWHLSNPFWRYGILQGAAVLLAFILGGSAGIVFFGMQAFIAVAQLELVNYVEHYGLTRKHLGDGKYEHALPRHSWNTDLRFTNWMLINLQRHSDHHYKPDRRFPLLQTYSEDEAPQFPYGYPVMTGLALVPRLWRRVMNPRVRDWRRRFYPEIEDWSPYNKGQNPMPRGA